MKGENTTVDYRGENLGIRVGPERCQTIIREHDKKTWVTYGAPDSYPKEKKYWTHTDKGFGILRLTVQVLRNEITSDLLEVLTGDKAFSSAQGHQFPPAPRKQMAKAAAEK